MAAKPTAGSRRIDPLFLKNIWTQLKKEDWLNLLKTIVPASNWASSGNIIKGKCPFHPDTTPSFHVDLNKRHAKCYGGGCGQFFWDPISFYVALQNSTKTVNIDYITAAEELRTKYGATLPKKDLTELSKRARHLEMKRVLLDIMRGELCDAYSYLNDPTQAPAHAHLAYAKPALDYLEYRGVPQGTYHELPIGVFPPEQRLEKLVVGYMQQHQIKNKNLWSEAKTYLALAFSNVQWLGSLVFFSGSSPENPCRLKLRKIPNNPGDEKEIIIIPDELESGTGFFGLYGTTPYAPHFASRDVKTFYLVEGEFDALSVFSRQFQQGNPNGFVFSGGGSSVDSLDVFTDFGFDSVHVIGDFDAGGLGYIKSTLKNTKALNARIFRWPPTLSVPGQAKTDPDAAVRFVGLDAFEEEVMDEAHYSKVHQWAESQALDALVNVNGDDIRQITSEVITWGLYIKDEAEQHAYLTAMAGNYPQLNVQQLINELRTENDDAESFIERLKRHLHSRLYFTKIVNTAKTPTVEAWDRQTNSLYHLNISDKQNIIANVEAMVRNDLVSYFQQATGLPAFLENVDPKKEIQDLALRKRERLGGYITTAVSRMLSKLPAMKNVKTLGQGFHYVVPEEEEASVKSVPRLYLANGNTLYRGDFLGENSVEWRVVDGPRDENVLLNIQHVDNRCYPTLRNLDALNAKPDISPAELYDKIHSLLVKGWSFKSHDVTCEYLAALIMQLTVANAVPLQPLVMFTAEAQSGKSSLMGGLIGKTTLPTINIVQEAVYVDMYTGAGVRQVMNGSSRVLCLDEFEDKGGHDRNSTQIRGILQLLRGHANEGGGYVQGSLSGNAVQYTFHCPVLLAGIRTPQDAADVSRMTFVEMDKTTGRDSPETVILDEFGEEYIGYVRSQLPLVMFNHAHQWREKFFKIKDEFRGGGDLVGGKVSRNRQQYYGVMAIMDVCGRDYKDWAQRYFAEKKGMFERVAQTSLSNDLFQEILSTPRIKVPGLSDIPRSLNSILSSENPDVINSTESGIYYDKGTGWILVHWPTVKNTLIYSPEYRDRNNLWLKEQASRIVYSVRDELVLRNEVMERMRSVFGNILSLNEMTAFNISSLIKEVTRTSALEVKGIESIDMTEQFAEQLAQVSFETPSAASAALKKSGKGGGKNGGSNGGGNGGGGGNGSGGGGTHDETPDIVTTLWDTTIIDEHSV